MRSPLGWQVTVARDEKICSILWLDRKSDAKVWIQENYGTILQSDLAKELTIVLWDWYLHGGQAPLGQTYGTVFQRKVWQGLLQIQQSEFPSYSSFSSRIGRPDAFRAVGQAIAANRLPLLIPCHRVGRKNGEIGQYAWGDSRKLKLLQMEGVR